ncbi:MAG: type III pantothenate kinase, partial [Myxococcota bacterium]
SNIKFGVHNGKVWTHSWPVQTVRDRMPGEYAVLLRSFFRDAGLELRSVSRVILSSVVPQLTDGLRVMLEHQVGRPPLVVGAHLDLGVRIGTESPHAVGADLLANAVAGYARFRAACVVISLGTATTLSAVSDAGELYGVSIAAGMGTTEKALVGGAAQLAHVPLEPPPDVLGTNTRHAMQSGLVLGHLALIEGLVARIQRSHGPHKVVASGGLVHLLADHTDLFDAVDPRLTLEGLRIIAERNA